MDVQNFQRKRASKEIRNIMAKFLKFIQLSSTAISGLASVAAPRVHHINVNTASVRLRMIVAAMINHNQ